MENTSGQGEAAALPAGVDTWNWGAFFLNWIWGIGNNTFIALVMFVPFVNMIMIFVLGAKGSAWAWRNKRWESVEQFKAIQRQWAKWGLIAWIGGAAVFVGMSFLIVASMKDSEAFKLAFSKLEANEQISQLVGKPMSTGMPMGEINVTGPKGSASLSFGVEGPKGKGTAYVEAVKDMGQWKIERFVFEEDGTGRRINLAE